MKTAKTLVIMAAALLVAAVLSSFKYASHEEDIITGNIDTLIAQNLLTAELNSSGGTHLIIKAKNISGKPIKLCIETGRRFISDDPSEQDVFVVKPQMVSIEPGKTKSLLVPGYCCEASMSSPKKGSGFSKGYMAPKPWVDVAGFLNRNESYMPQAQQAVWCMSNNHSLSSIRSLGNPSEDKLKMFIANAKGIQIPWWITEYEKPSGSSVFSGKAKTISGIIRFRTGTASGVKVIVADKQNRIWKEVTSSLACSSGEQVYPLRLDVSGWPEKDYTVYFYDGGEVLYKKNFSI